MNEEITSFVEGDMGHGETIKMNFNIKSALTSFPNLVGENTPLAVVEIMKFGPK